jgi:hypothetical protein
MFPNCRALVPSLNMVILPSRRDEVPSEQFVVLPKVVQDCAFAAVIAIANTSIRKPHRHPSCRGTSR